MSTNLKKSPVDLNILKSLFLLRLAGHKNIIITEVHTSNNSRYLKKPQMKHKKMDLNRIFRED